MDPPPSPAASAQRGLVEYTHWIYGLHALSVLIGIVNGRSIALRFAFALPSIIAVILNYARRSEAAGTWLESHFRWQIRTFWYSWLWIIVVSIISMPLILIFIGVILEAIGLGIIGIWVVYRVARGWLALREGRTLPLPAP